MTEFGFSIHYKSGAGCWARRGMADNLEQQISNCKGGSRQCKTGIEEQWADGLSTEATERVLAQELSWLKSLNEKLATREGTDAC